MSAAIRRELRRLLDPEQARHVKCQVLLADLLSASRADFLSITIRELARARTEHLHERLSGVDRWVAMYAPSGLPVIRAGAFTTERLQHDDVGEVSAVVGALAEDVLHGLVRARDGWHAATIAEVESAVLRQVLCVAAVMIEADKGRLSEADEGSAATLIDSQALTAIISTTPTKGNYNYWTAIKAIAAATEQAEADVEVELWLSTYVLVRNQTLLLWQLARGRAGKILVEGSLKGATSTLQAHISEHELHQGGRQPAGPRYDALVSDAASQRAVLVEFKSEAGITCRSKEGDEKIKAYARMAAAFGATAMLFHIDRLTSPATTECAGHTMSA